MSPIVQTLIRESYYVICSASHNFVCKLSVLSVRIS